MKHVNIEIGCKLKSWSRFKVKTWDKNRLNVAQNVNIF